MPNLKWASSLCVNDPAKQAQVSARVALHTPKEMDKRGQDLC